MPPGVVRGPGRPALEHEPIARGRGLRIAAPRCSLRVARGTKHLRADRSLIGPS